MRHFHFLSAMLGIYFITSMLTYAEPIQGSDKDTVWMQQTNSDGYWVIISHTNKYIAKGGGGTSFYDFNTGELLKTLGGSAQGFFISNDTQFIRINQTGAGIDIIDLNTWQVIGNLEMGNKSLRNNAIANVSNDGKYFISDVEGGLEIWNIETRQPQFFIPVKSDEKYLSELAYAGVHLSCDNRKVFAHVLKTFKPDNDPKHDYTLKYLIEFDLFQGDSTDVYEADLNSYISNDCQLYSTNTESKDSGIKIFNLTNKQLNFNLPTNGYTVTGMEFSPGNKYLYESNNSGAGYGINVWDLTNGSLHYKFQLYYEPSNQWVPFQHMDLSDDGKFIVSTTGKFMFLWTTEHALDNITEPSYSSEILYPNPTNNLINLIFILPKPQIIDINITNTSGKVIKQLFHGFLNEGQQNLNFNISDLSPTAYFVNISSMNYNKIFKLIINK